MDTLLEIPRIFSFIKSATVAVADVSLELQNVKVNKPFVDDLLDKALKDLYNAHSHATVLKNKI